MNNRLIIVKPAPGMFVEFARWGVEQNPKVATASHDAFAVTFDQLADAPEPFLLGALIDGHPYEPAEPESPEPGPELKPAPEPEPEPDSEPVPALEPAPMPEQEPELAQEPGQESEPEPEPKTAPTRRSGRRRNPREEN